MNRILVTVLTLLLAGCATTAGYEKLLDSWVGAEEVDLVRSWGPPQRAYETGGRKFLAYSERRNVHYPGRPPAYITTVVGNTAYSNPIGGSPAMNVRSTCITTFELQGTKVVAWSWKGDDCKAKE